jgi:hypothetical protein
MAMIKYGTFRMYQNIYTDEVVEVALADEEELEKYAGDHNWKEVGQEENNSDNTGSSNKEKKEL